MLMFRSNDDIEICKFKGNSVIITYSKHRSYTHYRFMKCIYVVKRLKIRTFRLYDNLHIKTN